MISFLLDTDFQETTSNLFQPNQNKEHRFECGICYNKIQEKM